MKIKNMMCVSMLAQAVALVSMSAHSADMIDLGNLGGGFSYANVVSANGSVVAGITTLANGDFRAFKYTDGTGMVDLGTLGGNNSLSIAISADGSAIAGQSTLLNGELRAFKHTDATGMVNLGTLGGDSSFSSAISADGTVVAGQAKLASGDAHAFKHTDAIGMVDLGTLGGNSSIANAVSANGAVVVGQAELATGNNHAFKYTDAAGMVDLGTLGGNSSLANAVSANGAVIAGQAAVVSGASHAFKYTDGTGMVDLGTLGGSASQATALSTNGAVVAGQATLANGDTHAFKHSDATGMVDLGTLGGNTSRASAVSADGALVVGDSTLSSGSLRAFKHTDGAGMVDLGTLGGDLSQATSVSADGGAIVGVSSTASGEVHGFIIRNTVTASLVDIDNTYTSLAKNANQLKSVLTLTDSLLSQSLDYDCTVFGKNNGCIAVGGGYTRVNSPSASLSGLNLRAAYRITPQVRVGAFVDQRIDDSLPGNYRINSSQPLMGAFAGWAAEEDGTGPQVKASFAFSRLDTQITRSQLSHTEAGKGNSTIKGQGVQLEVAYGIALNETWQAKPLLGIKRTKSQRDGYTENRGADFPMTYQDVEVAATSLYAGSEFIGKITPQIALVTRLGLEQDLSRSTSDYTAQADYLGGLDLKLADEQKTRGFASLGAHYKLSESSVISLNASVAQQPLEQAIGYGISASYSLGF